MSVGRYVCDHETMGQENDVERQENDVEGKENDVERQENDAEALQKGNEQLQEEACQENVVDLYVAPECCCAGNTR
jgi:hypothetical protein